MAQKNVGTLIKEARTGAGLTQEALAKKISGLTAADISKAERGEKDLTQAQLKAIAKATGVTQASLTGAPKGGTSSGKTTTTASGSSTTSMKVTAAEKKLVQLYRKADADAKKAAVKALEASAGGSDGDSSDLLSSLVSGAIGLLTGK